MSRARTRRLALAGLAGVALALASPLASGPAHAGGLTVTIDQPGPGQTISGSGTVTVSGSVTPDAFAEVHEVRYRLLRAGTEVDSGSVAGSSFSFTSSVPLNGPYTVQLTATGRGLANLVAVDGYADRDFAVAVPPAAPTGLTATLLDDRRVRLSWRGVSHADLRGYAIYRRTGGGGFSLIDGTLPGTTSYVDASPGPGGGVEYQVVALRNGAVVSNDPNQWLRSSPAGPAALTVPPAPGPDPGAGAGNPAGDTGAGGAGSGGSGGGSGVGGGDEAGAPATDLRSLFSATPAAAATGSRPAPTLPDLGFSATLPFPEAIGDPSAAAGTAAGRPAGSALPVDRARSSAGREPGADTDRRALLVPVAAGSVLCVAALHLRWLNRRLGAFPGGGGGDGAGGDLDPEPVETGGVEVDPDLFDVERLPVGAGR